MGKPNLKDKLLALSVIILFTAFFGFLPLFSQRILALKSSPVNLPVVSTVPVKEQAPSLDTQKTDSLPILMYHYIRDNQNQTDKIMLGLTISPENFKQEIQTMKEKNYQAILFSQIDKTAFDKQFIITFDDGYKDVIQNALPILKQFGFKATVFVITEKVGQADYLSFEDLSLLCKEGWEIGSHSVSHHDLTKLGYEQAKNEIAQSKKILEEKLGISVLSFCYPSGKFNEAVKNLVKESGYQYAVTTQNGYKNVKDDVWQLKRIRVSGDENLEKFKKALNLE